MCPPGSVFWLKRLCTGDAGDKPTEDCRNSMESAVAKYQHGIRLVYDQLVQANGQMEQVNTNQERAWFRLQAESYKTKLAWLNRTMGQFQWLLRNQYGAERKREVFPRANQRL